MLLGRFHRAWSVLIGTLIVLVPMELISPHPIGTLAFYSLRVPDSARIGKEG